MPGIDLHKVLKDSLQAIQPVAEEKEISILFDHAAEPFMTTLPFDEVLAPVLSLALHLIYILPKGRKISVAIMERYDSDAGIFCLRIEMKLGWFSINPNLIFKPDKNRFKLEQGENHESKIFIEWPLEEKTKSIPIIKPPFSNNGFETAVKENADLLDVSIYHKNLVSSMTEFGQNPVIQDRLKASKSKKESDFMTNLLECIAHNLHRSDFDSEALGKHLGFSKAQLYRKLKELTGQSVANYIRQQRLDKAAILLESTDLSVSEIANKVGFNELSYFSTSFLEHFNTTPSDWRKTKKMKQ